MSAHETLRGLLRYERVVARRPSMTIVCTLDMAERLLAEYDEATTRRTEGGPITGSRVPTEPGQWVNPPSSTPDLATPALADYTVPQPREDT